MKDVDHKYRKNYDQQFTFPLKIVVVARFEKQKDHMTIIQALKDVDRRLWICTFIGEGRLINHYKEYVAKCKLEENFFFKGALKEVYKELANHDLFLLCSLYEGLPRSILESMSVGLPIIATNVGGVSECVLDKVNGMLLDIQGKQQLSDYIHMILNNPAVLSRWGKANRIIYEQNFDYLTMLEKYKVEYRELFSTLGKANNEYYCSVFKKDFRSKFNFHDSAGLDFLFSSDLSVLFKKYEYYIIRIPRLFLML